MSLFRFDITKIVFKYYLPNYFINLNDNKRQQMAIYSAKYCHISNVECF